MLVLFSRSKTCNVTPELRTTGDTSEIAFQLFISFRKLRHRLTIIHFPLVTFSVFAVFLEWRIFLIVISIYIFLHICSMSRLSELPFVQLQKHVFFAKLVVPGKRIHLKISMENHLFTFLLIIWDEQLAKRAHSVG